MDPSIVFGFQSSPRIPLHFDDQIMNNRHFREYRATPALIFCEAETPIMTLNFAFDILLEFRITLPFREIVSNYFSQFFSLLQSTLILYLHYSVKPISYKCKHPEDTNQIMHKNLKLVNS